MRFTLRSLFWWMLIASVWLMSVRAWMAFNAFDGADQVTENPWLFASLQATISTVWVFFCLRHVIAWRRSKAGPREVAGD